MLTAGIGLAQVREGCVAVMTGPAMAHCKTDTNQGHHVSTSVLSIHVGSGAVLDVYPESPSVSTGKGHDYLLVPSFGNQPRSHRPISKHPAGKNLTHDLVQTLLH